MIVVRRVEGGEEWEQVLDLRRWVFVREQGVPPELERDALDEEAVHVLARDGGRVVGCGRLVMCDGEGRIGRLAVERSRRGQGIGSRILGKLLEIARSEGCTRAVIHAQVQTTGFYRGMGFVPVGDPFWEAGIEHRTMVLTLDGAPGSQ